MSPRKRRLLDYYRQFEELDPLEDARRLKERRSLERAAELERVGDLDLSRLDWHEPPDPEIVNAATFALRRAVNRYPEAGGPALAAVARRHDVDTARVALGHGAGQLLQALLRELAPGGEVVLPWPGWSPLPALVSRAGARPVAVALHDDGRPDLEAAAAAIVPATRAVVVCSPNDPTGGLADREAVLTLAAAHPAVTIVVDEALIEFAGEEHSLAAATAETPNLFVLRSFSKAWAMAGLRAGYLLGSPDAHDLLSVLSPGQGVAAPTQAAVAAALEQPARFELRLATRRALAARERAHLAAGLRDTGLSALPSHAHFAWLGGGEHTAASLTHALAQSRITVASGTGWGDEEHVRVTLADRRSTDRLLSALSALRT